MASKLEYVLIAALVMTAVVPTAMDAYEDSHYVAPLAGQKFRIGKVDLLVPNAERLTRVGDSSRRERDWPIQLELSSDLQIPGIQRIVISPVNKFDNARPPAVRDCVARNIAGQVCRHRHANGVEIEFNIGIENAHFSFDEVASVPHASRCQIELRSVLEPGDRVSTAYVCALRDRWPQAARSLDERLKSFRVPG